ncbi:DUF4232 domain-containing protein [Streptomyces sp. NPDC056121]|uniref:DUF4232 domain-containing protein n=1 Tax=Streptomyces sp. NPDC056121 TaxID=3345718 RepID=UPI0035D87F5B
MRVQKFFLLAVAVVAGLSLTACQSGDDSSSAQSSGSQNSGGSSASAGKGTGTAGSGATAGGSSGSASGTGTGACKTSQLAFSSSGGMAEGTLIVNLKNTGSATCTLKGFPGADLKGKDGTVSAERSKLAPPTVSVEAGEETRFTLHYPSNDSGGSGVTFTSLVVTPPDETHSHTLPVSINVPVSDGSGPAITVDPVGTGK